MKVLIFAFFCLNFAAVVYGQSITCVSQRVSQDSSLLQCLISFLVCSIYMHDPAIKCLGNMRNNVILILQRNPSSSGICQMACAPGLSQAYAACGFTSTSSIPNPIPIRKLNKRLQIISTPACQVLSCMHTFADSLCSLPQH